MAAVLVAAPAAVADSPHRHGVGSLNIAVDGTAVEIELEVPAADIVGFEHAARTQDQKDAVKAAVARLQDGAALFVLPAAAGCVLRDAEVEAPHAGGAHAHGHGHGHGDRETHSEFHAHYRFECSDPGRVTHLDVTYFKAFANARELETRLITATGQTANHLTAEKTRLTF